MFKNKRKSTLKKNNELERIKLIDEISKFNLEEIFPDEEVLKLQDEFLKKMKSDNPKENYTKLGHFSKNEVIYTEMYSKFFKQENSKNLLHGFYVETFWNYKLESLLFFYYNLGKPISSKVDFNNYITSSVSENGILRFIKLSKSKKFLVYKPRYSLEIKIIKKLGDNKMIELFKSVDFTILSKNEVFAKLIKTFDQQYYLHNFFHGVVYENLDNVCKQTFFKFADNKSTVGFKILKLIYKSSAKTMCKKTNKMLDTFYKEIKNGKKKLSRICNPIKDFDFKDILNGNFKLKFFKDFKCSKKHFRDDLGKGMSLTEIKSDEDEKEDDDDDSENKVIENKK